MLSFYDKGGVDFGTIEKGSPHFKEIILKKIPDTFKKMIGATSSANLYCKVTSYRLFKKLYRQLEYALFLDTSNSKPNQNYKAIMKWAIANFSGIAPDRFPEIEKTVSDFCFNNTFNEPGFHNSLGGLVAWLMLYALRGRWNVYMQWLTHHEVFIYLR